MQFILPSKLLKKSDICKSIRKKTRITAAIARDTGFSYRSRRSRLLLLALSGEALVCQTSETGAYERSYHEEPKLLQR